MRAILIDPENREITEVDHNGDYRQIYEFIKARPMDAVYLDPPNVMFVDDEGLYREPQYFFTFAGYHQPLAGRGLVLASDEEGETIGTTYELEELKKKIGWADIELKGMKSIPEGTTTGPDHWMPNAPVIGHYPIFGFKKEDGDDR